MNIYYIIYYEMHLETLQIIICMFIFIYGPKTPV